MRFQQPPTIRGRALSRKGLSLLFAAATLSIGILIGTLVSDRVGADDAQAGAAAPDAATLEIPTAEPVENQFTEIAKRVRPAVVNIHVETFRREASRRGGEDEGEGEGDQGRMDEFFRRFFGMPGAPEGLPRGRRRRPGEGSGVIVDPNGYILTNRHVVEDADRIQVRFDADDEPFEAKVIGSDEETDLAVIKVDAKGHPFEVARIGNSDAVNVGDWALAIGSPFGFRESVTLGIISAKSREVSGAASRPFQKFFQTDAAINPGNSGGPLVNVRGEVIGINTAIVSHSGAYEGLGFALPSNVAVGVYNQIIRHGRVARGSIGIQFEANQQAALLRTYGAPDGGVLVTRVTEGWPAEKAGMKAEDVIVAVDGASIRDGDHLIQIVASKDVGSTVDIEVVRTGERLNLDVEIADRAELIRAASGLEPSVEPKPEGEQKSDIDFGITVRNVTAAMKQESELTEEGVMVTDVDPASFADDIGMAPDDVIVAINRRPVASIRDVREIREELHSGDDVAFKVLRRGLAGWTTIYLAGVLPDSPSGSF